MSALGRKRTLELQGLVPNAEFTHIRDDKGRRQMASIFLSYAREDLAKATALARFLERKGHSVWWDRHIAGGAQYSQEIEQALLSADAVVVLWSNRSIESPWVRDEAAVGRDSGRLVPIRLDPSEPPLGFRQYQTIDLTCWNGRGKSSQLTPVLDAIGSVGAASKPGEGSATRTGRTVHSPIASNKRAVVLAIAATGLIFLTIAALLVWRPWSAKAAVPVVAISAGSGEPEAVELARDMLIKLGTLQSARADAFQLVDGTNSQNAADLILEAGRTVRSGQVHANLALFAGKDRSILWSKQFVGPSKEEAELRNQLSLASARALDCALQALAGERRQLGSEVIKLYLNGCTVLDDLSLNELHRAIPIFLEVTRRAPDFEGGWAKLLQAEILTLISGGGDPSLKQSMKEHIARARQINPHMSMAYLAEVELLPSIAYGDRMRLIDLASRHAPGRPEPFAARSYYLSVVGRMKESVESAKRASELNPLSPTLHTDYTSALADAGQLDRAKTELQRAGERWPGSSVFANAWFMFNLRYGDPREALRTEGGDHLFWRPQMTNAFLLARTTPTEKNIDAAVSEAFALKRQEGAIELPIETLGTFDRDQEVLPLVFNEPTGESGEIARALFRPTLRELRYDPRFMQIAQRLSLIDYWRTSGKWPDFCFDPDLPYDCKAEGAKISPLN